MSDTPIDSSKRTWLIATGCAGAVGGVATAVPFVSSFQPSEKAKAAGAAVEVDISALKPGEKMTVEWRGKPVWIVRRTPEQVAELPKTTTSWPTPNRCASPMSSRLLMLATSSAQSNPSTLWRSASAPTWVVRPPIVFPLAPSLRCLMTGRVVFFVPATVPHLTWLAVCTRTSPRQTTWKCLRTCTSPIPDC